MPGLRTPAVVLAAVLLTTGGSLSAAELLITRGSADDVTCDGTIRFELACDTAPCGEPIEVSPRPGRQPLSISPRARVSATLVSSNCWAAPSTWSALPETIEMVTWPAARLTGTIAGAVSGSMRATLRSTSPVRSPIDATIMCTIADGQWSCPAPAVPLDVRLQVDGFAPVYLWDVPVAAERHVAFRRGASISGWVEGTEGAVADARVEITSPRASASRDTPSTNLSVVTNERGFFQVVGVQPGLRHTLRARKDGFSESIVEDITVDEEREHLLRAAVRLEALASLQIAITPPVGPDGKPWRVRLSRATPQSPAYAIVTAELATLGGFWSKDDLHAGTYAVSILDSRDSVFERRDVEVKTGSDFLTFTISRVAVRGILRAGDDPLAARLSFTRSGRRVNMTSDAEGSFRGMLPEAGEWKVEITPAAAFSVVTRSVDVVARDGGAGAEIEIELPGGRLEGIVVDESGRPVMAAVDVRRERTIAYAETNAEGRFTLVGLEPQSVVVEAVTTSGESAAAPHDIGSRTPLRLVIERAKRIDIRLVAPSGAPVPGAIVRQIIPPSRRRKETVTGPDGKFTVTMTKAAPVTDIVIFAAGFPLRMLSLTADNAPSRIVVGGPASRLTVYVRRTPPWPKIRREDGSFFSLVELMFQGNPAGPPHGMIPGGFQADLEPGRYTVCPEARVTEACEARTLQPGAVVVLPLPWGAPMEAPADPTRSGR